MLAAALSGGAALVLVLTGCSDDDSGKKRDDWAKKVCDQVKPEVQKIRAANDSIDQASKENKSPEDVKKADSAAFQQISGAYKSLADAVDDAGAPPVDDGAKVQKDAVSELKGLSSQYADLKTRVDKLDPDKNFDEGLRGVATRLGELGKGGDKALNKLQSGDLGKAMAKQEGCKRPTGSATRSG
ncbi:small secreted protein [Streptomyces boncukensis]|nr:small secreted protein [Streptomyces boncukensis]